MILSRTCENAIRALIYLAQQEDRKYVPIKEIAERNGVSFHFLGKIMQILIQHNILTSYKGPNGGVAFNRSPEKIKAINIVEIFDGLNVFEKCVLGLPECGGDNPCALHHQWEPLKEQLKDIFASKNLKELAENQ